MKTLRRFRALLRSLYRRVIPAIPCGCLCTDCGQTHAEVAYSKRVMLCVSCDLKASAW